ncbi:MFS transporter [Rouxiella badensis]|uniref:MFS transporter n=1 Tax=Rouxiella badensis TaxID=1646377 RepID=UPI0017884420|nr:MFS transporter [Rouxiella badensis]QOI55622.1 MFS transporter [Rouxiella badensis subsp. acadiensis]
MKEVIRNRFLLMCAVVMMLVLSLFSSDIFLPALPDIVRQFGVTPSQGQQMLGHFLLGVALMQLVYGPLSDSLGRKKLLIFGTSLFILATFAIIYAPILRICWPFVWRRPLAQARVSCSGAQLLVTCLAKRKPVKSS